MTQADRISFRHAAAGLGAFALGLCAFCVPAHAEGVADDVPDAQADGATAAQVAGRSLTGQADKFRTLFEAAGRTGLVDLRGGGDADGGAEKDKDAPDSGDRPAKNPPDTVVADCDVLLPLAGGGQDGFADGLFTEMATDEATDDASGAALAGRLARTLADLADPAYDGRPLELDLSAAAECGPSFLPWQVLAAPGRDIGAGGETTLTGELSKMSDGLRRLLGLRIATRAALSGNMRLARRVSDTLIDSGLHGHPVHDRDPEHVLLDALLHRASDPVSVRARLSWLAERDGPEQMIAIDLLRTLDAAPVAQSELRRLSTSPEAGVRIEAQQRLLAHAVEDADIALVAEMVTANNNLADDPDSRARLAARLEATLDAGDPQAAIRALDVIDRMRAKGMQFTDALDAKATARLAAFATPLAPDAAPDATPNFRDGPSAQSDAPVVPAALNGPEADDYLDALGADIARYREVLANG
ncbi:MAG: hypothetical protein AAF311_02735 [Pseudomonadota bacterium]